MGRWILAGMIIVSIVMNRSPVLSMEKRKLEMREIAPFEVEGYQKEGQDEFYDRQTAFRYMDGAAELYRSYGFKLLMVRRYLKTNHPSIVLELFDMGSSEEAFGIFSYQTDEEEVGIGQASDYGGGLLRFWKGRFFVHLYAEKESPSTKRDLLTLGEVISKRMTKEGARPKLIQCLPREGLSERTIRYFHLHPILNHHYFISHENLLRLNERTEAVLATYRWKEEKTFLLLIRYPDSREARMAFSRFKKAYLPEAGSSNTIQIENGKWVAVRLYQKYLLIVFDAPSREDGEALIKTTYEYLKRRGGWLNKKQ